jgi:hypothetical protein
MTEAGPKKQDVTAWIGKIWLKTQTCRRGPFVNTETNCTFILPRIVIGFFLNNQPDALIIQILFCY